MTTAKRAPGRLAISLNLLRMVLDLPADLRIVAVVDRPGEGEVDLLVTGPGVPDGARLQAIYSDVKPTQAVLDRLEIDGRPMPDLGRQLHSLEGMNV